ncbi:G-protein coupled receptor Mth2-like isoform X8 [Athalia rosae]|uniref:G-protein coupled receptor Mth2-like isoform X8 n=1 Tax=Athalia rosae TaxID=37344 RepID=UPI002033B373|nr:G-protein coupled receptor Mth2-like isoform X8 [Athalia rosae]
MYSIFPRALILLSWVLIRAASLDRAQLSYADRGESRRMGGASDDRVPDCASSMINCVPICCPAGLYTSGTRCVENSELPASELQFPQVWTSDLVPVNRSDWIYARVYGFPCASGSYALSPDENPEDEFYLLENGTIYKPKYLEGTLLGTSDYCFASVLRGNESETVVAVCFADYSDTIPLIYPVAMLLSTPFLIATFVIYTVIPELDNIHGLTLRAYVGVLFLAYIALVTAQLGDQAVLATDALCTGLAFTIHFSFLASFFWLNVMCFDIWWTFGGFRALRGSIKQRERKKFFMYSIYAWGCAILLTAVCVIMDFVPGIPDTVIRPEFGEERCWFRTETAKALYFYGPMGLTVLCNIFLFVSTAIKIIRHKKDTAHHLKGTDSRRHDDNKQWFNLYLKLFIVMGINWSMEIISWLCQGPKSLWYITDMGNTLQGVIIFIIFVWKEKIKRLLIKRFGCQGPNFLPRDSTRSAYHSSASRTCTTSIPLHEETNGTPDPLSPSRAKPSLDDSDGV